MWLVVGLGNPGRRYEKTRHNIGFVLVEKLVSACGTASFQASKKFKADVAKAKLAGSDVVFIKPQTFMNLSGQAVAAVARFYRIVPTDLLVLHDEADLPLGTIRIKSGGGDGGHNGLKSVTSSLGTNSYHRIRMGVGRPEHTGDIADFLLNDFRASEQSDVEAMVDEAASAAAVAIEEGVKVAMNRFNRRA